MKSNLSTLAIASFLLVILLSSKAHVQDIYFTPFSFSTHFSTTGEFDPAQDIRLDYVVIDGEKFDNFVLVENIEIIENSENILSAVHGINTIDDQLVREGPATPNPTPEDLTASLQNLNLNSLINSNEEPGKVIIDIFFAKPESIFLFWERGGEVGSNISGNSGLKVTALSDDGTMVLASYQINPQEWQNAEFSLQNTIPNNPIQNVGSLGLKLEGVKSKRLRLSSINPQDAGPDYKVIAIY